MKSIIKRPESLPVKINELKNFIAIRRQEITAYRAKLRALDDIGLIEKRKEVLTEAQNKGFPGKGPPKCESIVHLPGPLFLWAIIREERN